MNVDGLTSELQRRALVGEMGAGGAAARVAGARRMARERRRRRIAGTAVAAVLVVLAGVGTVGALRPAPRPAPPADTGPIRLSADIDRWPQTWAGLSMGERFGGGGGPASEISFSPTDTDLAVVAVCRPAASVYRPGDHVVVAINGHRVGSFPCSPTDQPLTPFRYSADPAVNRDAWFWLGVRPGRLNAFRIQYVDAAGRWMRGRELGELAGGLYERPPGLLPVAQALPDADPSARSIFDAGLPRVLPKRGGGLFRLGDRTARTLTKDSRSLTLQVEAGPGPVRIRWGVVTARQTRTRDRLMRLTVDGREVRALADGGIDEITLDGRTRHTVRASMDPGIAGTLLLSAYTSDG